MIYYEYFTQVIKICQQQTGKKNNGVKNTERQKNNPGWEEEKEEQPNRGLGRRKWRLMAFVGAQPACRLSKAPG